MIYNRGKGAGIKFLRANVAHEGDDCLIWPMCRDTSNGYGRLGFEGQMCWAHRLMCQLAHGPAPTELHEASHACGNGHGGCVNPKHLDWKTPSENQAERRIHGTQGNHRGKYRLNGQQVQEIRASDKTQAELAAIYNVSPQNIGMILRGEIWQYLYRSPQHEKITKALESAARPQDIDAVMRATSLARGTVYLSLRKMRIRGEVVRINNTQYKLIAETRHS